MIQSRDDSSGARADPVASTDFTTDLSCSEHRPGLVSQSHSAAGGHPVLRVPNSAGAGSPPRLRRTLGDRLSRPTLAAVRGRVVSGRCGRPLGADLLLPPSAWRCTARHLSRRPTAARRDRVGAAAHPADCDSGYLQPRRDPRFLALAPQRPREPVGSTAPVSRPNTSFGCCGRRGGRSSRGNYSVRLCSGDSSSIWVVDGLVLSCSASRSDLGTTSKDGTPPSSRLRSVPPGVRST